MGHQPATQSPTGNVVPLFGHHRKPARPRILRISPECDGLELLYANDNHPDKLFSLKVLCWALRDDGEVVAMVPWLRQVVCCSELEDPLNGRWEGYRLPDSQYMFSEAPAHKVTELETALEFFGGKYDDEACVQEIPDTIGTHAICSSDGLHSLSLMEVISWRLMGDGQLHAMVAREDDVTQTPVLPGDACLEAVTDRGDFCYFFQHGIANRIKERDPEALAALSSLVDD